jgi:hypothetical protein
MHYYVFMTAHFGIAGKAKICCLLNNFHARLSIHVLNRSVARRMVGSTSADLMATKTCTAVHFHSPLQV